jgi:hypothetical protein
MDPERSSGREAGQVRIDLLRQLAHSLELGQAAVVGSDLGEITRQTAQQRELCAKLRQLPADPVRTQASGFPGALVRDRNEAWGEELAAVATKVALLNRRYEALLRRARRTVDIFCRVLAHSALTYPSPRPQAASFAAGFQE